MAGDTWLATVTVHLLATGHPVDDAESRLAISGSGDTWTYTFKDVQKYYTTPAGVKGQEIVYTLQATAEQPASSPFFFAQMKLFGFNALLLV